MSKIAKSLTELIGNTPMLELSGVARRYGTVARIVAKLESFNPGGSVKDRTALSMIEDAEARECCRPEPRLVEPTSGNTGWALPGLPAPEDTRRYSPCPRQ